KNLNRPTISKTTGNDTVVNDYRSYLPYAFLKEVPKERMEKIAIQLPRFHGFFASPISLRTYPYPCGANIFGYLSEVNYLEIKYDPKFYSIGDIIGRSGLERYYEDYLRGEKGKKIILYSAKGKRLADYAGGDLNIPAQQGKPLHLGLDIELQEYGEKLMK